MIEADEEPFKTDFDKIAKLRPAFEKDGTITAANASTINDGAAAVVLGGEKYKSKAKFKILSWAVHAVHPTWFTIAPVEAMKKAAVKAGVKVEDIGVFEINEAFSVVTMAAMKELNLKHDKVNINGGAVSLGHPIGVSGARIIVSLMNAMEQKNVSLGMAAICIGGGEALAMVISKIN
jgi:acetyl-CoA C-acetyltransferase